MKKAKTTAAKVIPLSISRSRQPKGKPAGPNKLSIKSAVVVFAVIGAMIIIWQWNRAPATKSTTTAVTQTGTSAAVATAPGMDTTTSGATAPTAGMSTYAGAEGTGLIIAAVRITPTQPMATDPITAVVSLAGGDAAGTTFTYQWKRNDQFIPEATTNVLKDTSIKRRDRVSVVVTAFRDGVSGPPVESQAVVVNSPPPALEMKILTPQVRLGQPFEIQLTGVAPDGGKAVYSLASPFVEGMTIDGNTGKIIWTPPRAFTGKLLFGAVAADPDGNKTSRVFELDMGVAPGP
ncbi:MAG: putative Ig domain-containing protein [Syntrophales bacterium]